MIFIPVGILKLVSERMPRGNSVPKIDLLQIILKRADGILLQIKGGAFPLTTYTVDGSSGEGKMPFLRVWEVLLS